MLAFNDNFLIKLLRLHPLIRFVACYFEGLIELQRQMTRSLESDLLASSQIPVRGSGHLKILPLDLIAIRA